MIERRLVLALALSCGAFTNVAAQNGLEVTMRVLDDVTDVDAVVLAIGGDSEEQADSAPAPTPDRDAAAEPADTGDGNDDALVPRREEDGEGGLEDRDVIEEPEPTVPAEGV